MLNRNLNNDKGMALALVIMVFAVIAILGTTTLGLSLSQTKQSVSTERQTEAYYIARSATDAVSTDIINQIKELNAIVPNASSTAIEIADYNEMETKLNNMLTTSNVIINGMANQPLNSQIVVTGTTDKTVTVETEYTLEGRTGRAKVQLGTITNSVETVTQSGVNTNAIYTWGNLDIGNGLTVTGGGSVGYGGTASIGNNSNVNANHEIFPIDIIPPHITVPVKANANSLISHKEKGSFPPTALTSANNGNYGTINLTSNNDTINWQVNTNNGDVVIVLNRLSVQGSDAQINVSGSGKFYLYLVEASPTGDTTKQLMDFKNNFDIVGKNPSTGAPLTYIISYTKKMQDAYLLGDTTTNANVMPYDSAYIKNSAVLDAFFYLPGVNLTIEQGNPKATGSIFASQFTLGNKATINFEPFDSGSVLSTSTSMGETSFTINKVEITGSSINTNLKKVWIK